MNKTASSSPDSSPTRAILPEPQSTSPSVPESESKPISTTDDDSFSFLSGPGTASSKEQTVEPKGADKIESADPAKITPVEQKANESEPGSKRKTRRVEPPDLPIENPKKKSSKLPPPEKPVEELPSGVVYTRYQPPEPSGTNDQGDKSSKPPASTTVPKGNSADYLIETRGLVKQYGGRRVVNGVDIHVGPGEVVGLLGKNGAGKTTTFYMIVGLVTPTIGHVYMGDEDVTRMPMYRRARRGIGYLPQEESIFRKLTVEENLLAILETLPLTEEERDARCDELLKDFGLEHVRENVAITLSGGEKRRVTIARALVTNPSLLLLDEPFAGVDPMAVHDIQEIIYSLKARGLGVLITDHTVRETLSVVDRAYIIDEGRVLSEGTREFILNDPIAREIYLGHRFSM